MKHFILRRCQNKPRFEHRGAISRDFIKYTYQVIDPETKEVVMRQFRNDLIVAALITGGDKPNRPHLIWFAFSNLAAVGKGFSAKVNPASLTGIAIIESRRVGGFDNVLFKNQEEGFQFGEVIDLNDLDPRFRADQPIWIIRRRKDGEIFGVQEIDQDTFQSIFPTEIADRSQLHLSLREAEEYIREVRAELAGMKKEHRQCNICCGDLGEGPHPPCLNPHCESNQ